MPNRLLNNKTIVTVKGFGMHKNKKFSIQI